jgi:hypothetical protein
MASLYLFYSTLLNLPSSDSNMAEIEPRCVGELA